MEQSCRYGCLGSYIDGWCNFAKIAVASSAGTEHAPLSELVTAELCIAESGCAEEGLCVLGEGAIEFDEDGTVGLQQGIGYCGYGAIEDEGVGVGYKEC